MNEPETNSPDFNRRDFLKSGSVATMMAMMGGVRLFAQTNGAPADAKAVGPKLKVALIGLGPWGREILTALARLPQAEIAAICDNYPAMVKRGAAIAPEAKTTDNADTILSDKDIKAVIIATGTHQHKDLALAALKAGKHVYCEAPLAHTIEDARTIASAAKAARHLVFQSGLQRRADKARQLLVQTFRSGALGTPVMARAQWHKKTSWRSPSPNPEREKQINWRLHQATSCGLAGEIGIHQFDAATWYMNQFPVAVTGAGSILFHKDDRDVPDTIQAKLEYPGGVNFTYDATLANSFDGEYELYFGSESAVMLRESDVWLFKEVDARLLGWEVYYPKETFHKETGIVLKVGASKVSANAQPTPEETITATPLFSALTAFVRNSSDFVAAREDYINAIGDDPEGLAEHLATKVQKRPAADHLVGYQAVVTAVKTNEAVLARQRIEIKPELYELG